MIDLASAYHKCCGMIAFLYELHSKSKDRFIFKKEWQGVVTNRLQMKHPVLFFAQNRLFQVLGIDVQPSFTVFAMLAQDMDHPSTAILAFRGTAEDAELINDARALLAAPLVSSSPFLQSTTTSRKKPIEEEITASQPLFSSSAVLPEDIEECKVGRGFLEMYTGLQGSRSVHHCICREECRAPTHRQMVQATGRNPLAFWWMAKKHPEVLEPSCATVPTANTSHIQTQKDNKTTTMAIECGARDRCDPSHPYGEAFHRMILSELRSFISLHAIERVIITGHSLGAAVATLCSLHVACEGIPVERLITLASPRVGNSAFATVLETKIGRDHIVRATNLDDLVTNVPLPYSPPVYYVHVGSSEYTFSLPERDLDRIARPPSVQRQQKGTRIAHSLFSMLAKSLGSPFAWGLSFFAPVGSPRRFDALGGDLSKELKQMFNVAVPYIKRAHNLKTYGKIPMIPLSPIQRSFLSSPFFSFS